MSGILDPGDQRLVARLLNDVNDAAPGVPVSTSQVSGSIIQPYYGMVGKRLVLTAAMASKFSDTTIGTLYEGIYQYVNFYTSEVLAAARGALVYWRDFESYVITTDVSASSNLGGPNSGLVAGVVLNVVTAGNYGFIQIAGKASVKFKTTITKATPAMGDLVLADGTTSSRGDLLNDASPITMALGKLILGVAITTPTSAGISLVDLWNLRQVMGGLGGF